jgi:hypothetical protein
MYGARQAVLIDCHPEFLSGVVKDYCVSRLFALQTGLSFGVSVLLPV